MTHFAQVGEAFSFDVHTPWQDLTAAARKVLARCARAHRGRRRSWRAGERTAASWGRKATFAGARLPEVLAWPVHQALTFCQTLKLEGNAAQIAEEVVREVLDRLFFLNEVGLGYLSLERRADTLSGGEAQRIRGWRHRWGRACAACCMSSTSRASACTRATRTSCSLPLRALCDRGNTVCVVEHRSPSRG